MNKKNGKISTSVLVLLLALLIFAGQSLGILPRRDPSQDSSAMSIVAALTAEAQEEREVSAPKVAKAPRATAKVTKAPAATLKAQGPIIEPQAIAEHLVAFGRLPDNFITKAEARSLGWDSRENYLSDVAPGKSIGGDRFGNYEGLLPKAKGRTYYECDCYYTSGPRNAYRVVYSNDGLIFYTDDHYESFTQLYPVK